MRCLILSDIHANWEALEASLAAVDGHYDRILCLGDIVGYGADPNRCVEWVRQNCPPGTLVRGNHDKVCCGLDDGAEFNPTALKAALWTKDALTPENLEYLRELPQGPLEIGKQTAEGDRSFVLVHGSPLDEDEYLVTGTDAGMAFEHDPYQLTFFGHTHIQGGFIANVAQHDWWGHGSGARVVRMKNPPGIATNLLEIDEREKYLLNPGSIGQPRDADNRAALAIYDPGTRVVEYWRIPYDIERTQTRILNAGLPEALANRLQHGR